MTELQENKKASRFGNAIGLLITAAGLLVLAVAGYLWLTTRAPSNDRPAKDEHAAAPPANPRAKQRSVDPNSATAAITTPLARRRAAAIRDDMDPGKDGWDTELFASRALAQLKPIKKTLAHPETIDAKALAGVVEESFVTTRLRPAELDEVFRDRLFSVARRREPQIRGPEAGVPEASEVRQAPGDEKIGDEKTYRGPSGLAEALTALAAPLKGTGNIRVKLKIFRVRPAGGEVRTRVRCEVAGFGQRSSVQQTAEWDVTWTVPAADAPPRLVSIDLADYEEVTFHAPAHAVAGVGDDLARAVEPIPASNPTRHKAATKKDLQSPAHRASMLQYKTQKPPACNTLFADCTESVMAGCDAWRDQLRYGVDHWRKRISGQFQIYIFGHQGLAVGDVNGDHLEDVYVSQPGGLPNLLFVQQLDGTLADVSRTAGVDLLDYTQAALLVDLDNDTDQDLVLALATHVLFLANDGKGIFTQVAIAPEAVRATSLTAVDYDMDGDLDVYAGLYYPLEADASEYPPRIVYHDAQNGAQNVLLKNDGGWRFSNATKAVGLDHNNNRFTFAAAWEDYDNDGDQDLYVANDFGRNNLYKNEGGRFRDVAAETGAEDQNFGMSAAWGDYDGDGWMDLYIANMFSSAGGRVTFQERFKPNITGETRNLFQRLARGNTLLKNTGGRFADVSEPAGVTMGRWGWGSLFVDINNDGRPDLVAANGFVTGELSGDL